MVAWVPAITHLSPMGTVLAPHHLDKLAAFNLLLQRNKLLCGIHSADGGLMRHLRLGAFLGIGFAPFLTRHRYHRPLLRHSYKSRHSFLCPCGMSTIQAAAYCTIGIDNSAPPAQRRQRGAFV
jgi:hypothetical protein